ncbi:hypothetical protein KI387_010169, partial [Taxus chinensis]
LSLLRLRDAVVLTIFPLGTEGLARWLPHQCKENGMSCVPDCMPSQMEINDKMRAILYDWL